MPETNDASDKRSLAPDLDTDLDTDAGAQDQDVVGNLDAVADGVVDGVVDDFLEATSAEDLPEPDPDGAAPQPVPGGSGYVWRRPPDALITWWWALPEQTRVALAALRPGDTLNATTARAAADAGLSCPRVPRVVQGHRVMDLIATATLVKTVQLARMAHSERRLV